MGKNGLNIAKMYEITKKNVSSKLVGMKETVVVYECVTCAVSYYNLL